MHQHQARSIPDQNLDPVRVVGHEIISSKKLPEQFFAPAPSSSYSATCTLLEPDYLSWGLQSCLAAVFLVPSKPKQSVPKTTNDSGRQLMKHLRGAGIAVAFAVATIVPAFAQTQPTQPSAYATFPRMTSALPTAPLNPCYAYSSFNPTSPCYTGTPYPSYAAIEPFAFPGTTNRRALPGAADLGEDQVRSRIEAKGYSNISGLQKDNHGIWRGKGTMQDGRPVAIVLDLEGNIYSEPSRLYIRIEPAPFRPSNK